MIVMEKGNPYNKKKIQHNYFFNNLKTIYLVRHAEGLHNKDPLYGSRDIDPILTENGINQANNAAIWLSNYIKDKDKYNFRFGTSYLQRTQQTIDPFISKIKPSSPYFIIPLIHEFGPIDEIEKSEQEIIDRIPPIGDNVPQYYSGKSKSVELYLDVRTQTTRAKIDQNWITILNSISPPANIALNAVDNASKSIKAKKRY